MRTKKNVIFINQAGVVSIVVSVIIMIVLTLIAVAFAQIMRREQRQALDRQLSSQAYYAAESAVNDAAFLLSTNPASLEELSNVAGCIDEVDGPLSEGVIDEEGKVEYSCVTIDSTPGVLRYDSIRVDESMQVELQPIDSPAGDPADLESLQIQWREQLGTANLGDTAALSLLPLPTEWPALRPGILRLEIIPVVNSLTAPYDRGDLISARKVFWLYPSRDSPTTSIDWNVPSGTIVAGRCNDAAFGDGQCSMEIDNMPGATNVTFILRMRSVYRNVETTIDGRLANNTDARFQGAQVQVDATGRANDVLRRISARIAVEQASSLPDYVLQGYDRVCKQLEIVSATDVSYDCY